MQKKTEIIAVCGKGGVGKTSLCAMMVKILSEDPSRKVLAIDADPAVGLAIALGFEPRMTVDDVRSILIRRIEEGTGGDRKDILSLLEYEMFNALEERDNLAFLAIGRPEKEGCYCQVNDILKDIINSMAENFDIVLIDGEAGIEQVNRRVMERVTRVVLVSDVSVKGLNVAATIKRVSDSTIAYDSIGLIMNRVRDGEKVERLTIPGGIPILCRVPEDATIRDYDIEGRSFMEMVECPAYRSLRECLGDFSLTGGL